MIDHSSNIFNKKGQNLQWLSQIACNPFSKECLVFQQGPKWRMVVNVLEVTCLNSLNDGIRLGGMFG